MERTGERVLLREFAAGDVDALHAVHADPRVMRYYDPEVGTREHARSLVTMFIDWANESPRRNFQLAIVDSDSSRLVGSGGVRTKDCPPGDAEFGIGIGSEWWGRGLAQEAARLGFTPGEPRRGDDWMTSRGWNARDWSLTRHAWERALLKP